MRNIASIGVFGPVCVRRSFCSVLSIATAPISSSDLVAFQRGRMEQLLDLEPALGQALRVVMVEEVLKNGTVRAESVGPEIGPHERACGPQLFLDERQG